MTGSLTTVRLRSGEPVTIRPMRAEDANRLVEYFAALSPATRDRYGPHPFDPETACRICATLDSNDILRMIATLSVEGSERIIAYVLLKMGVLEQDQERYAALGIPLDPETDATLAPSVADDYQNQGVGSMVMRHLLQVARTLGRRRIVLWWGVQATNDRAVHFYTKWGFRKVGEFFTDLNNYDMILDPDDGEPTASIERPEGTA